MNPLPEFRKRFRRALLVSLIVAVASLIVFQWLRAQSNSASSNAPSSATNAPAVQATTNATSAASSTPATNSAAAQGPANAASSASPTTNSPSIQTSTNQSNDMSEGLLQQSPGSSAIQDTTNPSYDTSAQEAQGVPNSPAVQDITNKPGSWDNLWQKGSPLHFGLTVGEMYDDNILISPNKTSSFLTHISPSIDFQKGDKTAPHMNYLNLYFSPTAYLYEGHSQYDRADYNADVYYQYTWTRLTLGLEQNYQHLTDANLDIGNLVTRNIYTTNFTGNYFFNDDLSFYGTASQQISVYPGITIKDWGIDTYALYQVAPKLLLGAGPRFDYIDISNASDETNYDFLARLKYSPGGKFYLGFNGGVEYLQYANNAPSHLLPIFDFNLNYQPTDGTYLFLGASRVTTNSYDQQGECILNSEVQVGVTQQFHQDIYFTLSMGYDIANYEFGSGATNNGPQRKDNYYFIKGGAEWDPQPWLKVQASYQWSEDDSNIAQNTFNDNQIDLQASVHF
ncbi:MAG: outer membrane beta-barrel protein [Methylacidiphilales bacterium]|nr:outer membrane beta-barrel protein [Candidatus Methylacidiphilales bacterium]